MAQKKGLLVNITPEDEAWAVSQDRWNCLVVRSIQRQMPEALYVTADTKGVGFSIPEDGPDGTRYVADPPPPELLRVFDLEHRVPDELRTFTLTVREAKPMKHTKRDNRVKAAKNRAQTRERRTRTKSPIVRTTNRFLDAEANE